jgi:hypothetical protein
LRAQDLLKPALATISTLLSLLFLAVPSQAQFCSSPPATNCRANSHTTLSASQYPYTEDIVPTLSSGSTLTGPSYTWTVLEGGCSDLGGNNLNGSQTFNALLRAQVKVSSTTAPAGSLYAVQLIVDGQQHGWFVRRLRGFYPQDDVFASTIQNVAAGNHSFQVQAQLLSAGQATFVNTYITAQGAPATYPSAQSVNGSQVTLLTTHYQPVTDVLTFTNNVAVDLAVQGYFQIDSGSIGQTLNLAAFLDGVRQTPITYAGIPPYLYDGINVITVLTGVQPGSHTLSLNVVTNGYSTQFSNRAIEFVAFPATTYSALVSSSILKQVNSGTTESQPAYLDTSCGLWTKLLEGSIPADAANGTWYNQVYEGYIHLPGNVSGSSWSQVSWETFFPGAGTDGGGREFQALNYVDGIYLFGDTGLFSQVNNSETIRFWARKVNPTCSAQYNGQQGSVDVTDRYFWVRHVPLGGGCLYN